MEEDAEHKQRKIMRSRHRDKQTQEHKTRTKKNHTNCDRENSTDNKKMQQRKTCEKVAEMETATETYTHTKIVSGEDYNKRREAANDTREERLLALIWRALEGTQRHTHRQKN